MANKPSTPMPLSVRAKQFLPFAAVKGLTEALEKKEKVFVSKVEMNEEREMELNEKIHLVQNGVTVKVTYFCIDTYIQLTGTVIQLDPNFYTLQIDDTIIKIDDILDFEFAE